jgi:hypothetical protein
MLVNIAAIALTTAFFGTLSGPLQNWGISDFVVRTFGLRLVEAEREGRIIMIYHTIAVTVVALETYMITHLVPMEDHERTQINATATFGFLITLVSGLWFAYFGHDFVLHGLYLFGLSLAFFSGILLAAALWPWRKAYRIQDKAYAHTKSGIPLERAAFFTMAVATLGSALFGAVTGSYWGNGHETFLAEDLVRDASRTKLQLAIIGHLHIMLTLVAVALALIIGRWFDFRGALHKAAMPLVIVGTAVVTLGAWAVVPFEDLAHKIIYVGSTLVLLAALFLVIFGFRQLTRTGQSASSDQPPRRMNALRSLLRDPLRFGVLWQMVFMNFTVSGPGIYMALNLEEIFRAWPARQERVILTGHWHILAGIIATIILLYYADLAGLKGRVRQVFGWVVIVGSDLAFAAAMIFALAPLFADGAGQAGLAGAMVILMDFGLAAVLLALAGVMIWRLVDLFEGQGRWREEFDESPSG